MRRYLSLLSHFKFSIEIVSVNIWWTWLKVCCCLMDYELISYCLATHLCCCCCSWDDGRPLQKVRLRRFKSDWLKFGTNVRKYGVGFFDTKRHSLRKLLPRGKWTRNICLVAPMQQRTPVTNQQYIRTFSYSRRITNVGRTAIDTCTWAAFRGGWLHRIPSSRGCRRPL